MATNPIHMGIYLNQTKIDTFFPLYLGLGMSLSFSQFQNTGTGLVIRI